MHAEIMMSISIRLSLTWSLPLWTMKTSWSLIEVSRLTDVSPLLNFFSSTLAGEVPRRSQMASVKRGWEEPEKIWTRLILERWKVVSLSSHRLPSPSFGSRHDQS